MLLLRERDQHRKVRVVDAGARSGGCSGTAATGVQGTLVESVCGGGEREEGDGVPGIGTDEEGVWRNDGTYGANVKI